MAGCSDYLDQKSPSELTADETFKSASFTQLTVNKLYGLMTDATYGQNIPIILGTNTDCELIDGLGSDAAANTTSERGNMNYNFSTSWRTLNTVWDGIYDIINNCNSIIDGINQYGGLNSDDAKIKKQYRQFMGEALTVRAMCYLDLVRLWGDVPFKTTFDANGSAMYSGGGKVDRDIILDAIILDLKKATEYLHWAGEGVGDITLTTERVTKGYAFALLSEVALTRAGYAIREASKDGYENLPEYSDAVYPTQRPGEAKRQEMYKLAAEAAYYVINDSHHNLNPSFANEWEKINQLILDTEYRENLFEIPTGCGVTGELGYSIGVRINGSTPFFGTKGNSSGKVKMTGSYWASFHNTGFSSKSEESWVALDTRRDITVYPFQIRVRSGRKIYNVTHAENIYYEEPTATGAWALYCGKWNPMKMSDAIIKVAQSSGDAKWSTGINVVRMRYSKVLLNYAEACFMIGGKDYKIENGPTALGALEEVHIRAYDTANKTKGKDFIDNLVSTEGFLEALCAENAWEFGGEGIRKYDLIRWGQLSHQILKMKTSYLDGVTLQLSQGGWPRTVYYLYKEKTNPGPDDTYANLGKFDTSKFGGLLITVPSSYCWGNGWPQYPGDSKKRTNADCQSATWFGTATENDRTNYLPYISAGLNPWNDIPEVQQAQASWSRDKLFAPQSNMTVKNRYILPIGALTISDSNGTLKNSYGY